MPAVALGRSAWTLEEAGHLKRCRDCQDEWELIQHSVELGNDVAAKIDPTTTARVVLQRLAAERETLRRRKKSWSFAALASAAAIAAMLWAGGPSTAPVVEPVPGATALQLPLPELDNLQPGELNSVLQTLDEPYVGDPTDSSAADDLDDEALDGGYDLLEG
jgi:hypothetical protein